MTGWVKNSGRKGPRAVDDERGMPPPPLDDGPGPTIEPPFTPIGVSVDGIYYLHDARGRFRALRVRDLDARGLLDICNGDETWLAHVAKPTRNGSLFEVQTAQARFMSLFRRVGIIDPTMARRGPGVWPDGKGGLVVHCGDSVLCDAAFQLGADGDWGMVKGQWQAAGFRHQIGLLSVAPALERPSLRVARAQDGAALEAAFGLWNYAKPGSAMLITGAVALAMLGAAPAWRVHVVFTGQLSSGKSTAADLTGAALGAAAVATEDATPAGLYGVANNCSVAILYDEAEGDTSAQEVVRMICSMSGAKGTRRYRGTADGGVKAFRLIGTVFMQAIHPPELSLAALSRIIEIDFRPLPDNADEEKARAAVTWAASQSAALRARMIARWPDFADSLSMFKSVLKELGFDFRLRDVYGHALASRWLLLHDDIPDADSARWDVSHVLEVVNPQIEELGDTDDRLCLLHLVTSSVDDWRGGVRPTLATLIGEGFDITHGSDARRVLIQNGIRIEHDAENQPWVLVAAAHRTLRRIFADTEWKGRGYVKALAQLDGAQRRGSTKFGRTSHRCIAFPAARLLDGAGLDRDPDEAREAAKDSTQEARDLRAFGESQPSEAETPPD